jgi:hypothetical protein
MSMRNLWENSFDGKGGFSTLVAEEERYLFNAGIISACEFEFGKHEDHSDCERMMSDMSGDDGYYASYNPMTGQWDAIL